MSLITIDPDKCKNDGICAAECPIKIISHKKGSSVPETNKAIEPFCINCGHCVAVCPHGALSLKTMPADECELIDNELFPSAEQVSILLKSRRSIRSYKKDIVPKEKIQEIIDTSRYAPTGHNTQTVKYMVIHDREELDNLLVKVIEWMEFMIEKQPEMAKMMHLDMIVAAYKFGIDTICRGAPHLIIAYGEQASTMTPTSCTIALSYFELAAYSQGLGACWCGFFDFAAKMWKPLQEELSLPEGNMSFGSMMLGYPKFKYHRIPKRNEADVTFR